jgi:fructosamine-3-kinase
VTLPGALADALEQELGGTVRAGTAASGGCIHTALRIETPGGPLFCKWSRGPAGAAFGAEARGLEALRRAARTAPLRIPRVVSWRDAEGDVPGWLVLEYLPPSAPAPDYDERLGRGLAEMHAPLAAAWGGGEPNRIGSLPQTNPDHERWTDFWREARLDPQVARASAGGLLTGDALRIVSGAAEATETLLGPVEDDGPAVVHGDLWAGNVHPGPDGGPVLVDPAAYRGHREVDLAMADLFGGLSHRARAAYEAARPLVAGYVGRRPLYQLYYLLVHLNLFGTGYLRACVRSAQETLGRR